MTLTIYEGYDKTTVTIKEAGKPNGLRWQIRTDNLYRELAKIVEFVNIDLGEECLFEVD